jgi:uncharacterized membrane protein YoaK (UPF0700 family)
MIYALLISFMVGVVCGVLIDAGFNEWKRLFGK